MADLKLRLAVYILVVALAVTAGTASQKQRKDPSARRVYSNTKDEIWTIAVGSLGTREAYLDPLSGEPKGFYVDVIDAVCKRANMDCRLVYDRYSNCWTSVDGEEYGGVGLFNYYYDACAAWYHTYNRAHTFQFTEAFGKNQGSGFIVPTGNPSGFNWMDLTERKIGFVTGFASTPLCVAQNAEVVIGASLSDDQIVYYDSLPGMVQGVIDGEVDAGFESLFPNTDVVDFIEAEVFCSVDGIGLMHRKDNPINDWWNPAWQQVRDSEEYEMICNNLLEEHGDLPGPNPEDLCISE